MSVSEAVQAYLARQPVYNRRRRWLHAFLRGLVWLLSSGEVTGREHIPASGSTILMMNHAAGIDPLLCTRLVETRYVISMAKIETLRNPPVALFNHLWGNFTVHRGEVDRYALQLTLELLKHGELVLIAPEGTRNRDGLGQPKDGVAYVAVKADAVVVPAAVVATDNWWQRLLTFRRVHWKVHFGPAFQFKISGGRLTHEQRETMMREAMYQLALAMPDEYARYRGEFKDVENATTDTLEFISSQEKS